MGGSGNTRVRYLARFDHILGLEALSSDQTDVPLIWINKGPGPVPRRTQNLWNIICVQSALPTPGPSGAAAD
jgi:hypothetical protein